MDIKADAPPRLPRIHRKLSRKRREARRQGAGVESRAAGHEQGCVFCSYPRTGTPAYSNDFGLVAIATVAITTVMTATETGMTNALVQATHREREHYDVAWTIGLIRGSLVCAVLCLAAPFVASLFGDPQATPLVRMMAFLPLAQLDQQPAHDRSDARAEVLTDRRRRDARGPR